MTRKMGTSAASLFVPLELKLSAHPLPHPDLEGRGSGTLYSVKESEGERTSLLLTLPNKHECDVPGPGDVLCVLGEEGHTPCVFQLPGPQSRGVGWTEKTGNQKEKKWVGRELSGVQAGGNLSEPLGLCCCQPTHK